MPERSLRVAVVADLLEERWPSMDLVADMLVEHLPRVRGGIRLYPELLRPTMPPRGTGLGRFVNRYWDYPRWLKGEAGRFDVFHVVDHSYAHVVHALPAARTVVTCHDVDAFLPLVDPPLSHTRLPNALTRRILSGMHRAAHVACDSRATFDDAIAYRLLALERASVVPIGTRPGFTPQPDPEADRRIEALAGPRQARAIEALHVGSCIARKRIDRLLRVFAAIRAAEPDARLLKAGGAFTDAQRRLIAELGLADAVVQLPFLDAAQLAALYRRADVVLLTSDREGFGLPVVEALSCGTPIVATDLPVFREVGGDAVTYCTADDVGQWVAAFRQACSASPEASAARRAQGIARAAGFTWDACAASMADIYLHVAGLSEPSRADQPDTRGRHAAVTVGTA